MLLPTICIVVYYLLARRSMINYWTERVRISARKTK